MFRHCFNRHIVESVIPLFIHEYSLKIMVACIVIFYAEKYIEYTLILK